MEEAGGRGLRATTVMDFRVQQRRPILGRALDFPQFRGVGGSNLFKLRVKRKREGYSLYKCDQLLSLSFGIAVVVVVVNQSCPSLCDPMDWSQPGSRGHGTLQARILEWVIPFSRGSS